MGFYSSLFEIKNKILQKQICIITGNVDDIILPKFLGVDWNTSDLNIFTMPHYLMKILEELDFHDVQYFHPTLGILSNENIDTVKNFNLNPTENNFNNFSLSTFISKMKQEITLLQQDDISRQKKVYIIDFAEILLSYTNMDMTATKISEIISCFMSLADRKIKSYLDFPYKLILICRNKNLLNQFFTNKNSEILFHNIPKPNVNERMQFISTFKDLFNFSNGYDLLDVNELDNATMLTSDFTFREIFQMIRINDYYTVDNFKSLYNLVTFDKKESEWEKFNNSKLKSLTNFLKERVKGQDEAIEQIKKTIIKSYVGLSGVVQSNKSNKPKGILFFAGPTGVGKTELAKSLTEFVFGDESKFIRFDMSEYSLEHSDQKLIGAPPGYVGYESGGQLTNAVKEKPFSILLFDEIEKAHGKILDKFLQILEDGRLTSSKGELIDFSETFIIFTSNIGSDLVSNIYNNNGRQKEIYIDAIKEFFVNRLKRPEILNRIGIKNIVPFNHIVDENVIRDIIKHKFNVLKDKLLMEKNINLNQKNENDFYELLQLIKFDYQPSLGARGLISSFESIFVDHLVDFLFANFESQNCRCNNINYIEFTVKDNRVCFELKQSVWE